MEVNRGEHGPCSDDEFWIEAYCIAPQTIHSQLVELSQKHEDISLDLEREKKAARLTQGEASEWKRRFQDLQQSVVSILLLPSPQRVG